MFALYKISAKFLRGQSGLTAKVPTFPCFKIGKIIHLAQKGQMGDYFIHAHVDIERLPLIKFGNLRNGKFRNSTTVKSWPKPCWQVEIQYA